MHLRVAGEWGFRLNQCPRPAPRPASERLRPRLLVICAPASWLILRACRLPLGASTMTSKTASRIYACQSRSRHDNLIERCWRGTFGAEDRAECFRREGDGTEADVWRANPRCEKLVQLALDRIRTSARPLSSDQTGHRSYDFPANPCLDFKWTSSI